MQRYPQPSWEEIYEFWTEHNCIGPPVLKKPIELVEVRVNPHRDGDDYYWYDWLSSDEYKSRTKLIEADPSRFSDIRRPTNRGTIHTLRMLIDAKTDEERAAIWMYAFAKEVYASASSGNPMRLAMNLCDAAEEYLSPRFVLWHPNMKKLVPRVFVYYRMYREAEPSSIEAALEYPRSIKEPRSIETVVELARLNAALVLHECVPMLYTSLGKGVQPEGYIYCVRKRPN